MANFLTSAIILSWLALGAASPSATELLETAGAPSVGRAEVLAQAAASKSAPASVAGPYRTLREIDLHEGPGAKTHVVAKLPAGIKVNVVRAEGDWLRVESKKGGKPGYLERKSVERWTDR